MKVVGFEAALRGWALWKQYLENTTRNTHHAFIFADSYAELNDGAVGIPANGGTTRLAIKPRQSASRVAQIPGERTENGFAFALSSSVVKLLHLIRRQWYRSD